MRRTRTNVTDHAVIRYLERVMGVDVAAIRAEIALNVDVARDHRGASAVIADGFKYRMDGGTVVTVIPAHQKSHHARHRKRKS